MVSSNCLLSIERYKLVVEGKAVIHRVRRESFHDDQLIEPRYMVKRAIILKGTLKFWKNIQVFTKVFEDCDVCFPSLGEPSSRCCIRRVRLIQELPT